MTTTMTEQDLYNIVLRRREAYILFLARESSDISVLPQPLTQKEEQLYEYCCIADNTDDEVAYTKTVPAGALPYASVNKLGGKTVVWNQIADLLYKDGSTYDVSGITYTFSTNGKSVFADGTATAVANRNVVSFKIVDGHKYLLRGCPNGGSNSTYCLLVSYQSDSFDYGEGSIFTAKVTSTATANRMVIARVFAGATVDNIEYTPQLFDLTLMFGAGNEPTTVAEFRRMFPAGWYEYNESSLLSAGVTDIVSKDANNTTIDTYSIPAEVKSLTGYGWSAEDVCNYVDLDAKKFVQNVGSRAYASGDESDATVITDGTTTYYPLATPVETDISSYLTDDVISVECGGTLTFPNSNGDDCLLPVPSSVTYTIDRRNL